MNKLDWLVLSVLAAVAAWPAVVYGVRHLASVFRRGGGDSPATARSLETWRQKWTATLISLLESVEVGDGHVSPKAASLCRELMWEIIGGTDDPQPKAQSVKK